MSTITHTREESSRQLPIGWRWATVGETGRYINGVAFKPSDWGNEGLPIIRIQNLTNPHRTLNRTTRKVDAIYRVEAGDMLVSWSATLDAFLWDRETGLLNQHIFKVVADENIAEKRFLFYLLKLAINEMIKTEHLHGSTMKHINRGPFLAHRVALPSLPEQQRIVAEIEKQFTRLEAGVAALRRVQANLKRYRAAILKAACEGKLVPTEADLARKESRAYETGEQLLARILTERRQKWQGRGKCKEPVTLDAINLPTLPEGWTWATMPQLGELNRGKSKHRPRDEARLYGGPHPFVQTGDIRRSKGTIREHTQTYSDFGLQQSRLWPAGTLAITIAANIAETALLSYPACFPDSVVGFIHESESTVVRYVELFIRTAKEKLTQFAPATAQKNINLNILQKVAIPFPPLAEQTRIVAEVERRLSVVEELETVVSANLQRATRLRQSILQKAFSGDLLSNGGLANAKGRSE